MNFFKYGNVINDYGNSRAYCKISAKGSLGTRLKCPKLGRSIDILFALHGWVMLHIVRQIKTYSPLFGCL